MTTELRRRNLFLPDDLMQAAAKIADQRGVSVAEVVRVALAAYLKAVKKAQDARQEPRHAPN